MTALNTKDLYTLALVADRDAVDTPCRTALEKLARLDMIEPCEEGVCISSKGRDILSKKIA